MNQNLLFSEPKGGDEQLFSEKISKVLNTCELSKSLIISIYLAKENRFVYCNKIFQKTTGYVAQKLLDNGWEFWYSMVVPSELSMVKSKINDFFSKPLVRDGLTLQYHINASCGKKIYIKHEIFIYKLKEQTFALNYILDVSEKEEIEQCLKINGGHRWSSVFKEQFIRISTREGEVLKLIANGFSSKQIADKLFISNHTAISHRKHLIQKFQVKNTAQLIKEASKVLEL